MTMVHNHIFYHTRKFMILSMTVIMTLAFAQSSLSHFSQGIDNTALTHDYNNLSAVMDTHPDSVGAYLNTISVGH